MTIKELSKKLSVSPGTIDRVIHNRGRVSKETEEKVKNGLKKYGYVVNPNGLALAMLQKKHSVAIIVPEQTDSYFANIMQKGLKDTYPLLKNLGVDIHELYYTLREENEVCQQIEKALSLNANAIIILTPSFPRVTELLKKASENDCFIVALNIQMETDICDVFIGHDNYSSGRTAMQILLSQLPPESSVALFTGVSDEISHTNRTTGAISYLNEHSDDYTLANCINIDFHQSAESLLSQIELDLKDKQIDGVLILPLFPLPINTLKELINNKKLIIGAYDLTHNNIKNLMDGSISFVIEQNPYHQAKKSIETVYNYLFYGNTKFLDYHTDNTIITKENLGIYLKNHNYIPFKPEKI